MFVWASLPDGLDSSALLVRAIENEVAYVPGAPFFADAPQVNTLRMSFITYAPEVVTEGLGRLAQVFRS